MALLPWQTATVTSITQLTPNTRSFVLQVNELDVFHFEPGQFVTLDLPIHEKPNKRWRSYSIASWPNGTKSFELVIVLLQGGLGTTYLFNEVVVGTVITYRGAMGVFTLPEELPNNLVLVCTGTGVAPFRSMAHYLLGVGCNKNIHLVFGCRTQQDLLYKNEFEKLQDTYPNFKYHPTLSRETWSGHTGHVHEVYKALSITMPDAQYYLCGWKVMIDEARTTLT